MSSQTDICNLALSHVGQGSGISNFDTDQSEAARACRLFYEVARKSTLRDYDWAFATRYRALSLIEEEPLEDLGEEWAYSYGYPANCIRLRRILSGTRTDGNATKVKFRVANTDAARVIFTDEAEPVSEITEDITETARFDEDFVAALSYRLAAFLAPRLARTDQAKISQNCLQMYRYTVSQALGNSVAEDESDELKYGDLYDAR